MALLNTAKAVYAGPTAAKKIYRGNSVVWTSVPPMSVFYGSSVWINDLTPVTNLYGAPNDVVACKTNYGDIRTIIRFNFAAIPANSIIDRVIFGARFRISGPSQTTLVAMAQENVTTGDSKSIASPSASLTDYEFTSSKSWTLAQLLSTYTDVRVSTNGPGPEPNMCTLCVDAAWVKVAHHL
jgi:hypothetical protein